MMISDFLNDSRISRLIELALLEDVGLGDATSEAILDKDDLGKAEILCKEDGVLAGIEVAALVFQLCDHSLTLDARVADGSPIRKGDLVATVDGGIKPMLIGERTALNFLQRMSGIATQTLRYVETVRGTRAKINDTRKTAPGLRVLDKWAVRLGGGVNHRFGLDDMILIKENHIAAAGGITNAIQRCVEYVEQAKLNISIEVETRNLKEVEEALTCEGVSRVMLDNYPLEEMRKAVLLINHRVDVEASGGVNLNTVRSIAETGVDFISVGALTHSVKALDLSLELVHTSIPH